jgi:hypothetical protein
MAYIRVRYIPSCENSRLYTRLLICEDCYNYSTNLKYCKLCLGNQCLSKCRYIKRHKRPTPQASVFCGSPFVRTIDYLATVEYRSMTALLPSRFWDHSVVWKPLSSTVTAGILIDASQPSASPVIGYASNTGTSPYPAAFA